MSTQTKSHALKERIQKFKEQRCVINIPNYVTLNGHTIEQ